MNHKLKEALEKYQEHQVILNGVIVNPVHAEEYKLMESVFPAFHFPVHMYRDSSYAQPTDWDKLLERIKAGEDVTTELQIVTRLYPENIVTAANLVRIRPPNLQGMSVEDYKKLPTVAVLVGARHHDKLMRVQWYQLIHAFEEELFCHIKDQGFINQWGYYRDREPAFQVVIFHGKQFRGRITEGDIERGILFSEMLH